MDHSRVYRMAFARVYPLYIQKAEKKRRTREVDEIICWLTGYDKKSLQKQMERHGQIWTALRMHINKETWLKRTPS